MIADSEDRSLVVRLRLTGESTLHAELTADRIRLQEDVETVAASVADDLWIEKLEVSTKNVGIVSGIDPSIAGRLKAAIAEAGSDGTLEDELERILAPVRVKFPAAAHWDQLEVSLKESAGGLATELAKSILTKSSSS